MKTSARCATLLPCCFLAACASMIKPKYVNPRIYSELTCEQLRAEHAQTSTWLAQVSGHEAKSGIRNAGSILLFGLPMPLTPMQPSQIASLKGRLVAMETVAADKHCGALE
jgi:hypothetical protein